MAIGIIVSKIATKFEKPCLFFHASDSIHSVTVYQKVPGMFRNPPRKSGVGQTMNEVGLDGVFRTQTFVFKTHMDTDF